MASYSLAAGRGNKCPVNNINNVTNNELKAYFIKTKAI